MAQISNSIHLPEKAMNFLEVLVQTKILDLCLSKKAVGLQCFVNAVLKRRKPSSRLSQAQSVPHRHPEYRVSYGGSALAFADRRNPFLLTMNGI